MMNLTKMEKMVLNAMRTNEFNDCYEESCTWAFTVVDTSGLEEKQAGGVISSLIKKGLVWFQKDEEESIIGLTEAGKKLFEEADGEELRWSNARLLKIEEKQEEKKMTVKEMREEAKELGIKGYSRMSKEQLQTALEERTATEEDFNGEVKVIMRAFTGMYIGIFKAVFAGGVYTVETKKGFLTFNKDGRQVNAKNPKFANRIELGVSPDDFLTGNKTTARGGSIFHVTALHKELMNELGYNFLFNSDDKRYEILGNGKRAFAIVK